MKRRTIREDIARWNKLAKTDIINEAEDKLSNTALASSFKKNAMEIAEDIPNILNNEFAKIIKDVREIAQDKQKMFRLIKFIAKLKEPKEENGKDDPKNAKEDPKNSESEE